MNDINRRLSSVPLTCYDCSRAWGKPCESFGWVCKDFEWAEMPLSVIDEALRVLEGASAMRKSNRPVRSVERLARIAKLANDMICALLVPPK